MDLLSGEWEKKESEIKLRAERDRQRSEEVRKAKEETERKAKAEEERKRQEEVKRAKEEAEKKRAEEQKKREIPKTYTNSLGMEFVLVEAGEFMMGAVPQDKKAYVYEEPQHKVRITEPFYIGKFPVTQEEWEKVMGNNPSYFQKAGKKAPVETVSWNDCQEFIKKLGKKEGKTYRLPTEAEWEYAARGGGAAGSYVYTYGDDAGKLGDYAWYDDNSSGTTHPVGQKKPNSIGLYDMMGNVWEWCEDCFDEDFYKNSPSADPKGVENDEYRSIRGGSWYYFARNSRLSYRNNYDPDNRNFSFGVRLVLLP